MLIGGLDFRPSSLSEVLQPARGSFPAFRKPSKNLVFQFAVRKVRRTFIPTKDGIWSKETILGTRPLLRAQFFSISCISCQSA